MKTYSISYVVKDNAKDSIEGYSLYNKILKGWSEEHIEHICNIPEKDIRSIVLLTDKELKKYQKGESNAKLD
tara:strand:- start:16 stop:231 length:216 start_codon:yes stop_codon:yes gene_type:complete